MTFEEKLNHIRSMVARPNPSLPESINYTLQLIEDIENEYNSKQLLASTIPTMQKTLTEYKEQLTVLEKQRGIGLRAVHKITVLEAKIEYLEHKVEFLIDHSREYEGEVL